MVLKSSVIVCIHLFVCELNCLCGVMVSGAMCPNVQNSLRTPNMVGTWVQLCVFLCVCVFEKGLVYT